MPTPAKGVPSKAAPASAAKAAPSNEPVPLESTTFPPLYEAAILYSADYYQAAQEVLKEHLKTPAGRQNIRTWLMLFDFYQLTGNRQEFDALSILFTVKLERSPPVWIDSQDAGDPRRKEKRERKDFFLVKPDEEGGLLGQVDKFESFVKEMGSARIDFSKILSLLADEAELFALVLQRVRRSRMPLWFNSLDAFIALLKKSINETPNKNQGYWSLLFELYILDARLTEYEELGLEYAMAFEMSPPAWETVTRPTGSNEGSTAGAPKAALPAAQPGFAMKGVISASNKEILQQLSAYAASRQEVMIDAGGLLRIDFVEASAFFEAIRAIHLAQKRVILSNVNELVAALLEIFGMSKHAILMRKRAA